MNVKEHQEIVVVETLDGDFTRVFNRLENELYWTNKHIKFMYNFDGTWTKFSMRNYPKVMDSCFLEDDYNKLLRIEKLKRILENE